MNTLNQTMLHKLFNLSKQNEDVGVQIIRTGQLTDIEIMRVVRQTMRHPLTVQAAIETIHWDTKRPEELMKLFAMGKYNWRIGQRILLTGRLSDTDIRAVIRKTGYDSDVIDTAIYALRLHKRTREELTHLFHFLDKIPAIGAAIIKTGILTWRAVTNILSATQYHEKTTRAAIEQARTEAELLSIWRRARRTRTVFAAVLERSLLSDSSILTLIRTVISEWEVTEKEIYLCAISLRSEVSYLQLLEVLNRNGNAAVPLIRGGIDKGMITIYTAIKIARRTNWHNAAVEEVVRCIPWSDLEQNEAWTFLSLLHGHPIAAQAMLESREWGVSDLLRVLYVSGGDHDIMGSIVSKIPLTETTVPLLIGTLQKLR